MATTEEVITAMFRLRSKIDEVKTKHKAEIAELEKPLSKMSNFILALLEEQGMQNINIAGVGTVYKKRFVSVSVGDWDATWEYINKHQRWDLLNHAVNKTVVEAIVEETKVPPPGVNYAASIDLGFNRARGTSDV
jgi:hypothetical protein